VNGGITLVGVNLGSFSWLLYWDGLKFDTTYCIYLPFPTYYYHPTSAKDHFLHDGEGQGIFLYSYESMYA
jgi:hypothetical protein